MKETHEAWWGPQKVSSPPLGMKGRKELCPPKAESCAKEEELPTTPMLRQGGSGKQGKLSNFFLLPPSDFLPVFPTGSQRARGALDRSSLEVSRGVWKINAEDWMQRNQHVY